MNVDADVVLHVDVEVAAVVVVVVVDGEVVVHVDAEVGLVYLVSCRFHVRQWMGR